jgi:hypothetical protein
MNKMIYTLFFLAFATVAFGQESYQSASPYWVVETNINTPRHSVVRFYTAKHELVYQEAVTGKKVRFENTRVKTLLDKALLQAVIKGNKPTDTTWVAGILKGKIGV